MPKTSKARRRGVINHARTGNSVQGTGKASRRGVINHAPTTEHVTQADKSAVGAGLTHITQADKSAVGAINRPLQRPFLSPAVRGPESLIFPALVALGCWGMVIYFLFLTSEANHILFGGMAVLMALLWTFSFGTRVRKLLQQRSRM